MASALLGKSKITIASNTLVCKDSDLRGEISIGNRTVIHPKAQIIAEAGPIIIGENNLIEEQVFIWNRAKEDRESDSNRQTVMIIGNNNVFEVGCHVESLKIGDNNVLESKSKIGKCTELTSGCVIGVMCEVTSNEVVPENTVIFGSNCERRLQAEKPAPQTLQLQFLSKILPNYHYIRKTSKPDSFK